MKNSSRGREGEGEVIRIDMYGWTDGYLLPRTAPTTTTTTTIITISVNGKSNLINHFRAVVERL